MLSKGLLWLYVIFMAKAAAYENLALNKQRKQSSTFDSYGIAEKGNDGDTNNSPNYPGNSCIHTDQNISISEAWWRVNLGFITRIHKIVITYRQGFAAKLAGFSIFVSNTSDFRTGIRCFKHIGSLSDVETTPYPCLAIGQFVTVYNDRFRNTTYPDDYFTDGAVLELCEVEVPGCSTQRYGQDCGNICFCKGLTCDYKRGKCDGDCQPGYTGEACNRPCDPGFFGDTCVSQCPNCGGDKTCDQSGVCTNGCEPGYFQGQSAGCPHKCGQCVGVVCNMDWTCANGCKDGYYLSTCNSSCPINCINSTCKQETLNCLSCKDGYYGTKCDKKCPDNCLNKKCNMNSGYCIECVPGHYGYNCINQCLHCGGYKTCNDFGFCLTGCETGYISDHSPGCRLKRDYCKGEITSNLIIPLAVGITSGILLVLLGIILNVILYRRNRAHSEKESYIYMQSGEGNPREHVYRDLQHDTQNSNVNDGNKTGERKEIIYDNATQKIADVKTQSGTDYINLRI